MSKHHSSYIPTVFERLERKGDGEGALPTIVIIIIDCELWIMRNRLRLYPLVDDGFHRNFKKETKRTAVTYATPLLVTLLCPSSLTTIKGFIAVHYLK